jgi:hypothetical protein
MADLSVELYPFVLDKAVFGTQDFKYFLRLYFYDFRKKVQLKFCSTTIQTGDSLVENVMKSSKTELLNLKYNWRFSTLERIIGFLKKTTAVNRFQPFTNINEG